MTTPTPIPTEAQIETSCFTAVETIAAGLTNQHTVDLIFKALWTIPHFQQVLKLVHPQPVMAFLELKAAMRTAPEALDSALGTWISNIQTKAVEGLLSVEHQNYWAARNARRAQRCNDFSHSIATTPPLPSLKRTRDRLVK